MADLSSILGGMVQGFKDFGTGLVDFFGTGAANIGDIASSIATGRATTKNQDDFRKWLYQTDDTQDAAAKGLGTILNGVSTVADVIPGTQAVTANPLFNGLQGAIGGVSDELKMAGENADLGRAAQRAGVGAASGLASGYAGQALGKSGNKLLSNGLTRGAVSGALGGGIANAGYTGIEGGSVQDMINAGLYGAQTGALVGGTTGLARELMKPAHKMDVAMTDDERKVRLANIDDQLAKLDTSTQEGIDRHNELMMARIKYEQPETSGNPMMTKVMPEYTTIYHNTPLDNVDSIVKNGIKADTGARKYADKSEVGVWGSSVKGDGYGGSTIAFRMPADEAKKYMVNDTEYLIPRDIAPEDIVDVDRMLVSSGGATLKQSQIPEKIAKYGEDKVVEVMKRFGADDNTIKAMLGKNNKVSKYLEAPTDAKLPARYSNLISKAKITKSPKTVADLMNEPKTYYHGSPELDITEFDINRAGKNTRSGEKAIYFTDTPEAAEEFAYERIPTDSNFIDKVGKRGGVYEANLDMRNTLDLDNLTDEQIKELWPYASYMGSWQGEDVFARDIKKWRDVKNPQLIKGYLDLEKLANSPYDSFSATMYPNTGNKAKEYAIFDASKAKITKSPKTVADLMNEPKQNTVADLMLSPEQKEFFKDSVIRDENGNLMPLYHGSNSKFTVFDSSKGGKSNKTAKVGHWFTPSKEAAEKWAGQAWWGDNEPSVYETYLNIKKPMVYEAVDNSVPIKKLEVQLKQAEDRLNSTYRGSQEYYDAYREYNNIANEIDNLSYTDPYEQFRSHIYAMEGKTPSQANAGGVGMAMNDEDAAVQKYVDMLKSEGYDGIIIKGTGYDQKVMGGPNDQYVVFDSNQIKSVNNKKPTKSADINYALAGLLGTGGLAAALAAAAPKDDKKKKSEVK